MLRVVIVGVLVVSAAASAQAPRYLATPVADIHHACNPANPDWYAPVVATALAADGRVLCEANCGSTTGGSRPYIAMPDGSIATLPYGTFSFTKPVAFLEGSTALMLGDWCPPVTGTCTTALALGAPGGEIAIIGASSATTSVVNGSNEAGWAVGWGGISTTGAWRLRPDRTLEQLALGGGWGLSADAVSYGGIAAGSAHVGSITVAVRWDATGVAQQLTPVETGTSASALGVGPDGSVFGQSNGRAARWAQNGAPFALLPVGSASRATHMAGNPMTADPLGAWILGTHSNQTKIFRSSLGGQWTDLGAGATAMLAVSVMGRPTPSFFVALGHDAMYQPMPLVWWLGGALTPLKSVTVNPPAGIEHFLIVDSNMSRQILANASHNSSPYVFTQLAPGDTDGDGTVGGPDLTRVMASWGTVPQGTRGAADFDGDGQVNAADLSVVLSAWGS